MHITVSSAKHEFEVFYLTVLLEVFSHKSSENGANTQASDAGF